jgi:hypothetical protein
VFDTWKNDKFKALYEAVQSGVLAGKTIVKWNAGDTGVEKEVQFALTPENIAAVNAEYRLRFPSQVGRPRRRVAVAQF